MSGQEKINLVLKRSVLIEMNQESLLQTLCEQIKEDEKLFVFDLDFCLYNSEELKQFENEKAKNIFVEKNKGTGFDWDHCNKTIQPWAAMFLKICKINVFEFFNEIDICDFDKFLSKNEKVIEALASVNHTKVLMSNGGKKRIEKILSIIGLENTFDVIFAPDSNATEMPLMKPEVEAFGFVEQKMGVKNSQNVYFFDDNIKNIEGAIKKGWNCFHVDANICEKIEEALLHAEKSK
ncbi:SDT1 [Ecytonucleospora hepatopenaei]|uniref:SDT1 n=1 Tax=Ecytonucleospora hepatopenaei TaxID=646526 RepID=A0A1W0E3S5_9MICR|nr:SDT1 [Ecytonucleospora hepatopenaei]